MLNCLWHQKGSLEPVVLQVGAVTALGGSRAYFCPALVSGASLIVALMEFAGFSGWVSAIIMIRADAIILKLLIFM